MRIKCFLHSRADDGSFLGMETIDDIFEFQGNDLQSSFEELNLEIRTFIGDEYWEKIKDNCFDIQYDYAQGNTCVISIDIVKPIFD